MLDLNRLKILINKHRFLSLGSVVVVLLVIIVIAVPSQPKTTRPLLPGQKIIPTTTPIQPTLYSPPNTIDLSQTENTVGVNEATSYLIPPNTTISLTTKNILTQFQLPTEPENINTQFIQVQTWRGPNYYLSHNLFAHQISLGRNDETKIAKTGAFRSPTSLASDATSLVNSLAVFALEIKFKLERYSYLSAGERPEPTDSSKAQIIQLVLTPQIDNWPVYQQEIPFIEATYDRANKLVKLTITNPIPAFTKSAAQPIATVNQLKARPSAEFFRLFVKPETADQYFLSAPDIRALNPNRLSLGFFLRNSTLAPIYLLESNNYLYATKAFE
ncbi:hypothetical protein HYU91_00105 [Candidatus Collierbacteria bacterium]|nr:hypothetical protein [Candidatus Collierbacteria bacterium]